MSDQIYMVRQNPLAFIMFGVAGCLFFIMPWISKIRVPWWGVVLSISLGVLAIGVGFIGWKAARIGLVVERRGIWCRVSSTQKQLVPWESILGTKLVTWTSPEGEHRGIVLGLTEDFDGPLKGPVLKGFKRELESRVGTVEFAQPLLLAHDEWDWNIDECYQLMSHCVSNPAQRGELGEYTG